MTGGVAHDFNNLLTAVLANLDLAKKYLPDGSPLLRPIDGAIQGAERGANLTKRLLAFARRQELRPEAVDIAGLLDSMAEMLRHMLGPAIHIATDFAPGLVPIRVDRNQLELALLNLAVNSRDAMPAGGQLTIAACPERLLRGGVAGLRPGEYVRIDVKDTGNGMDETTLRRAAEPFFTTKGQGRGTGLGLSMVDGLVAQSGGVMRISSRPGSGTTVEVWLPVSQMHEPDRPKLAPTLARIGYRRALRVLVVDDDAMVGAGPRQC